MADFFSTIGFIMSNKQFIDGCTAATHVAYAFSEIATIYPITPIASMGDTADRWSLGGRKNLFGSTMKVHEMESELGAAGATHGALAAGAFATTFTSSQGLMLMIPNMYKIAGELLPTVFHVGTRSLATHALSIFGDHQDVMACRATGFAMLCSNNVQETMDMAVVSHLAAIDGSVPVLHFFDGWRTSNQMSTVDVIPYDAMKPLVNWDKVAEFRRRALNPEHPTLRGSSQMPGEYFQNTEARNPYYHAFPSIVQDAMNRVATVTGRQYHLADYNGAPDATHIIVSMGSSCEVVRDAMAQLNINGCKTGLVSVRLYRPFPTQEFIAALPPTVTHIAVLDSTKEHGAIGEPLFVDVSAAIKQSGRDITVIGGRYGLSSKEFTPQMALAVYGNLMAATPQSPFTIGINDDVTHLSLDYSDYEYQEPDAENIKRCLFYGIGSDGTIGATRQIAQIISGNTDNYCQLYFNYSAKKSGGYTISELRYGSQPIRSEYSITRADYLACNKDNYVDRFTMVDRIVDAGIFVLNAPWSADELSQRLPASMRRQIVAKRISLYTIDATAVAARHNLGVRVNTIMAAVFFKLMDTDADFVDAIARLKKTITDTYMHEGAEEVNNNIAAVDDAILSITTIDYPASWADATDTPIPENTSLPPFINNVAVPCMKLLGDNLPVSAFTPDGTMPMGTTAYEKRRIAINVPTWDLNKCVQCTQCSFVCPHAAIRPWLLSQTEMQSAPAGLTAAQAHAPALKDYKYRIQVYTEDCTGCGSCAVVCPGKALTMVPLASQLDAQIPLLDYIQKNVSIKDNLLPRNSVVGSQLHQPLLEFSGACAGCGETPYVKLLTQLMGERLLIANATGCSSIWGANYPSNAYCTNRNGKGPAWGNSLFEDNAEYGFGMACANDLRRNALRATIETLISDTATPQHLKDAAQAWGDAYDKPGDSATAGQTLLQAIKSSGLDNATTQAIAAAADMLAVKSVWAIGGDGWAYDIGFAGLDHVLAQNIDINILVMDTECYSNTGGQMSKATPFSAVTKYSADGKRTFKKDLGRMMMTYPDVYVASIAMGANYMQAINALVEADAHRGPSIVIAYCPCINHGIRSGMSHAMVEEKLAVKSGYWQLYRYNPDRIAQGLDPMQVDSAAPDGTLVQFINGENRYADLRMIDPKTAAALQPQLQQRATRLYSIISTIK